MASVLGDAVRGGHGSTPLGWMSLQGERSKGTDLHSKTAAAAQVTRDQAKILNYARIYGAGEPFARLLLKQFNPDLTDMDVTARARHMYEQTKGIRGYKLNAKGQWIFDFVMENGNRYQGEMISKKLINMLTKTRILLDQIIRESKHVEHNGKVIFCHVLQDEAKSLFCNYAERNLEGCQDILLDDQQLRGFFNHLEERLKPQRESDYGVLSSLVQQNVWYGGSESHTFNRLEEIAMSDYPRTPVLGRLFFPLCKSIHVPDLAIITIYPENCKNL